MVLGNGAGLKKKRKKKRVDLKILLSQVTLHWNKHYQRITVKKKLKSIVSYMPNRYAF